MKVFISHSTSEKWAARKISEEINALGCVTFLDEKNIETGQPIDDSIHGHLNDCDHFLLLLSPSSLKSHWVLIELGGALALRKHIVPIMLYVGPNEIPEPIKKYLARDINELDKYYQELKNAISGASSPRKERSVKKVRPRPRVFKIGDRVRLPSEPNQPKIGVVDWNKDGEMDKYCGQEATITALYKNYAARVDIDNEAWVWAFDWLSPVHGR